MTTVVDICNRALDEMGARVLITTMAEATPQGKVATRQYDTMRKQLLRAAPWGFARKTALLVNEGLLSANPPTSPYPWLAKNTYPTDCLKMHYILPQPTNVAVEGVPNVSDILYAPWCAPSRSYRYLPAYDPGTTSPVVAPHRVILTNITPVLGIYTVDVIDPNLFDELFTNALVMALANKFVMPLSGNVKLKSSYAALADQAITAARVTDANEAVPTTEHVPDWIAVRGAGGGYATPGSEIGMWYAGHDNMNWGM